MLIEVSELRIINVTSLEWKRLDPFQEKSNIGETEIEEYGFSIYSQGIRIDFYVEDPETLDRWIENLSSYMILTGFGEDFNLEK